MELDRLYEEIKYLIDSKREDDYWDFKECHHENKANLVHDIICMANNRADQDAYIIFGVTDKTFDIVGVEEDVIRRNQQNILDILKEKKFSGGIRPRVELRSIKIYGHQLDVLIVKNSTDTPYYLLEDYRDKDRNVRAHHIYTRVGDTHDTGTFRLSYL
jgi:predicted HTH transcriptional regulator